MDKQKNFYFYIVLVSAASSRGLRPRALIDFVTSLSLEAQLATVVA